MLDALSLTHTAWFLTSLLEAVLLLFLLQRKLYLTRPAFVAYIVGVLLQSVLALVVYRRWGSDSASVWALMWSSQLLVIAARANAVVEIARRNLAPYTGVLALARRILLFMTFASLAYSLLLSRLNWSLIVVNLDRGIELSIAVGIVTLVLFVRHYGLPMNPLDRALTIGFCLYSCLFVINDSLFERWRASYQTFWNFLNILTFLATLVMWATAVRSAEYPEFSQAPAPADSSVDHQMSAELDLRLR